MTGCQWPVAPAWPVLLIDIPTTSLPTNGILQMIMLMTDEIANEPTAIAAIANGVGTDPFRCYVATLCLTYSTA